MVDDDVLKIGNGSVKLVKESENIIADSETCQKCAKCCLQYTMYVDETWKNEALRLSWLKTDKIRVIKVPNGYRIEFLYGCEQLIKKQGKWYCEKYGEDRPDFCIEYPNNLKDVNAERKFCPILRRRFPMFESLKDRK